MLDELDIAMRILDKKTRRGVFNQVSSVLGGTIRATSTLGKGLRVQMRLPRELGA